MATEIWTLQRGSGGKLILVLIMAILSIFVYWQVQSTVVDAHGIVDDDVDSVEGNVITVIDGNTITVNVDYQQITVRLLGVDTPEDDECMYEEASNTLQNLILYQNVVVKTDDSQNKIDGYDRLLGYVFVNNLDVGKEMLRLGYAKTHKYNKPFRYLDEYTEAELNAQGNRFGIWGLECD